MASFVFIFSRAVFGVVFGYFRPTRALFTCAMLSYIFWQINSRDSLNDYVHERLIFGLFGTSRKESPHANHSGLFQV